jgi:beta-mannosidase
VRLPEPTQRVPLTRVRVEGHDEIVLGDGWEAAACPPDTHTDATALDGLAWLPARVPGTAAGALRDAGRWRPGDPRDLDAEDWWWRTSFDAQPVVASEEVRLCLDGIATVAEVYLNGELVLASDSMFAAHALDVAGKLQEKNELAIRCRALAPLLRERRKPRARWRTRLVEGNLRFFRTMLLGRAPGFASDPAAVGPWREVRLERRRALAIDELALRPSVIGVDGRLRVQARIRGLDGDALTSAEMELSGPTGISRAPLTLADRDDGVEAHGELLVPSVALWWPHTHGEPALYEARMIVTSTAATLSIDAGRVGFRDLAFGPGPDHDVERDGLDLHVNGVRVFARGAVWTPIDAAGLAPTPATLRVALEQVRDAGMNMLRIPATGAYESETFHDLCDELGILVWQDFMFANMDYPISDEAFRASVEEEAAQVLETVAGRPSLAVLCGNSEVEQQVAMLGLDPALGRGELFGELLPALVDESGADAVYVPSAPCGGDLPFRPNRGVANYYGVGGYRRPLEDARRAEVRFAAECLAFSNVPDESAIEEMLPGAAGGLAVHHPRWKAGVPRDAGTGWDFEDVRDHYLALLFDLDPGELRRVDHDRYLELSRTVTGEVMAEVFGEWRRAGSPCGGGMVLWLRDLAPGAGWGVVDHLGEPKVAYHYLRRALAPVAVWTTDEGLGGVAVHVANDRSEPLLANLRVALYRDLEHCVAEVTTDMEIRPHESSTHDLEALLGRFTDASWAYRFGPPAQDAIVVSLESEDAGERQLISQAVRFPTGRPLSLEAGERIGLKASARPGEDGNTCLTVTSRRLAWGVRMQLPGFFADDDAFSIEPGHARVVTARACTSHRSFSGGTVTALNLRGTASIELAAELTSEAIA